jgi:uncharacterized protein YjiK
MHHKIELGLLSLALAFAGVSTVFANTVPAQVTNVQGFGYNGRADLSWNEVIDTTGLATTTDYIIEYKTSGVTEYQTYDDGVSLNTSVSVNSLANATAYDFRVSAVNEFGTGEASAVTSVTPEPIVGLTSPTPAHGAVLSTSNVSIYGSILTSLAQSYKVAVVRNSDGVEVTSDTTPDVSVHFDLSSLSSVITNQDLSASDDNYSGVAYVSTTDSIYIVRNSRDQIKEFTPTGTLIRTITCTACGDIEGIALVSSVANQAGGYDHTFMISTEDAGKIFRVAIPSTGSVTVDASDYYNTGITHGTNLGLEGIAYNPSTGTYYVVREKTNMGIFEVTLGDNHSAVSTQICTNVNLGSYATDLSDATYANGTLYVLSHESKKVMPFNISDPAACTVGTQFSLPAITQAEGLSWNNTGSTLFVIGESDFLSTYASSAKFGSSFSGIPNGTYRAIASITDSRGVTETAPYTTFEVYVAPPADTTAPVISSVSITTQSTSATITWITNEAATSMVKYGRTTSYGSTATSTGSTSHSVTLTGLTAGTKYNYKIFATDAASNTSSTANAMFTTKKSLGQRAAK